MVFSNPFHQSTFQKQVLKTSAYTCKFVTSKKKDNNYRIAYPKWDVRLRECRLQTGICVQDLFHPEHSLMLQLFFQEVLILRKEIKNLFCINILTHVYHVKSSIYGLLGVCMKLLGHPYEPFNHTIYGFFLLFIKL